MVDVQVGAQGAQGAPDAQDFLNVEKPTGNSNVS